MILSKSIYVRAGSENTRQRSRVLFVAALLLLAAVTLASATAQEGEPRRGLAAEELPVDDRELWRVELLGVYVDPADRELLAVATGLPQLIRDALDAVPTHRLSLAERRATARGLLENLELETVRRKNDLHGQLDRLPFSERSPLERESEARTLRKRLTEVEERLAKLRATEPERIEIATEKPVEVVMPEKPRFRPFYDLRSVAEERRSDSLIYGELQRSDAYLFLTLYEYSYHLDRERTIGETASRAEELSDNLDRTLAAAQRTVAGRPVTSLSVDIFGYEPEEAEVVVGEESRGFGSLSVPVLPVGETTVQVRHPAVGLIERRIILSGDERNTIAVEIPVPETGYVALLSEPPGADIYIGSLWQGRTPLMIRRPPEARQTRLSLSDHYDSQFVLGPESPETVTRELVPVTLEWERVVEEKRDRFYRSFGWFVVSLPAPIILNGIYGNLSTLFPNGTARAGLSTEEAERRLDQADAVFYGYYASLGLSVGLFGNMLFRLIDYIRTGEGYHQR